MVEPNKAQIDLWNGRVGDKWAAMQVSLDAMLSPVTAELQARAGPVNGQRVLDVGCGAGQTCMAWLDAGASVTGIDVSAALLAVAARRTHGKARLLQADASTWRSEVPFDLAVSRFGVMFFDDPAAAFASITANLRPGGRLLFACWRAATENEWVTTPMGAIHDLLPQNGPPPAPDAPGPFALADRDRLRGILARAGLDRIAIEPFDCPVCLANGGGLDAAVGMAMQIGPSGTALAEASPEVRAAAAERLKKALGPHERNGEIMLAGATWMVEAFRPL